VRGEWGVIRRRHHAASTSPATPTTAPVAAPIRAKDGEREASGKNSRGDLLPDAVVIEE